MKHRGAAVPVNRVRADSLEPIQVGIPTYTRAPFLENVKYV